MHLLYLFILFYAQTGWSAQQLTVDFLEVPPMTSSTDTKHGIIGEIVQAVVKRAGYDLKIFDLPTARAISTVAGSNDTLIAPLARIKDREDKFIWIAPLVKVERAFYSLSTKVHSFSEARQKFKLVAVARGSATESILLENGFSKNQLVQVSSGDTGPRMMLAGRVDALYHLVSETHLILNRIQSIQKVHKSINMGSSINYLGCSKICSDKVVKKLRRAIKSMAKDGSLKKIETSYGNIEGLEINFDFSGY